MSRYDYYDYQPSKAIATNEGIKAKSKKGAFAKSWWATRWIKALERLVDSGRLQRGRSYARQGQVLGIQETDGGINAKVQGSSRSPYKIRIEITALRDEQWEKMLDALSEQAIFTAQLLAGEMPQEIEQVFATAKVSLFPEKRAELRTDCSCPDSANPCKHIAAVYYLLGEQFDEDPFMIFRLRGRTQEQIMAELRARRSDMATEEEEEAEPEELFIPLTETLANFWDMGQSLDQFKTFIKPPPTPLPILKRLGQPSFLNEDVLKILGPVYQTITEMAIETAFGGKTGE